MPLGPASVRREVTGSTQKVVADLSALVEETLSVSGMLLTKAFGRQDRAPYAALYTTLGCPFTCTFCCIQAPFKAGEAAAARRAMQNHLQNSHDRFAAALVETTTPTRRAA